MMRLGHTVLALDMVDDYGNEFVLGKDPLPLGDGRADIILCNYVLMFLSPGERHQVIKEFKRIASSGTRIMVELYAAKDSYAVNDTELAEMQKKVFKKLGWNKLRYSKGRFIAEAP
jgi:ubiquinone/menaquinone biosynthesis C-methylase UbiE